MATFRSAHLDFEGEIRINRITSGPTSGLAPLKRSLGLVLHALAQVGGCAARTVRRAVG